MKLSRRVNELAESATLKVTGLAAQMIRDGIDVVSFAAGEPDFDTPDTFKAAAVAALKAGQTKYGSPASGSPAAKQAVCAKLARDNGLTYTPDQVVITSGGKMAVYLAMQALLDPGDEVIIPKPYWVSYPEIVGLAGGVPVYVTGPEENSYKLGPDDLRAALTDRTRIVVFNSPSNPSGATYTPDEIRALAEVVADRDLCVISDEIYDQLTYDDQTAKSFAAASEKAYAQTLTLNSVSKTYAMTGWRMGYSAGPIALIKAMAKLQSQMTSGAVTFNQAALVAALESSPQQLDDMLYEFDRRRLRMFERICAMPGMRCRKPTGAFYCFPNVSGTFKKLGISSSAEFAKRLIEEARVAAVPGIAFGMDEHMRFSFATSMDRIDEGLDRIEKFLA